MGDVITLSIQRQEEKFCFCPTPTAEGIINILRYCQNFGEMGVIGGPPGVGKTETIKHYVAANGHAWMVTATETTGKLAPCLSAICDAMELWTAEVSALGLRRAIANHLRYRTGCIIVIDEAQHLADNTAEELRSLYDELGLSVVFIGQTELLTRWMTENGSAKPRWAQLASRLGPRYRIHGALPEDVAAVCEGHWRWGIDHKAMVCLQGIATDTAGVRDPVKVTVLAGGIAGESNPITAEHVDTAMKLRGMVR